MSRRKVTRREFLKGAAAAAATVTILPRRAFAGPDKLNIACVGCGGKGAGDVRGVASENIVALCDVDFRAAEGRIRAFPEAKRYRDFRHMLHDMGDKIDAVTVSTPDHMHFPIAMMAMEMGKHVFVQKPMAHTVWEARQMQIVAEERGLATQMGNQGHASEGTRLVYEWVRSGAIGAVREVHFWTDRPIWPQGIEPPEDRPLVPVHLDWNLWLGTAPERPYHPAYAPFRWRGWWDFGCGALGDIGCHVMDAAFWALDLRAPEWIEAESDAKDENTTPTWSIVTYQFPARSVGSPPPGGQALVSPARGGRPDDAARSVGSSGRPDDAARSVGTPPPGGQALVSPARGGRPDDAARRDMPPVKVVWYDGRKKPPRPKGLDEGRKMGGNGAVLIGDDGGIMHDFYCGSPRIYPEAKMKQVGRPPRMVERVKGGHYQEWIRACKGGTPAGSNFVDHSGPLTEMVLLGNLAVRSGRRVRWDSKNLTCNPAMANKFVRHPYRIF